MEIVVRPYKIDDKAALFELIKSEKEEWADYTRNGEAVEKYSKAINNSIVYVACFNGIICGYIRAKDDNGYGIYIHDLLVHREYRGNNFGRLLIEQICKDFSGAVYVMSDVDEYYKKQGYEIAGTIFVVRKVNNKLI